MYLGGNTYIGGVCRTSKEVGVGDLLIDAEGFTYSTQAANSDFA